MKATATFNGTVLTSETLAATRQWFADNAQACIDEATRGDVRVNDLAQYIVWRQDQAAASLRGDSDHTFTFLQRAYYIQTGDACPPDPKNGVIVWAARNPEYMKEFDGEPVATIELI